MIESQLIDIITSPIATDSSFKNNFVLFFIHYSAIFLLNIVSYSYVGVKIFKVFCYSKLTFEWLPMINPFVWPFSIFHLLTAPYFKLWAKILPPIKFEKSSLEISAIIALEALNSLLYFFVVFANTLVLTLEETQKVINML